MIGKPNGRRTSVWFDCSHQLWTRTIRWNKILDEQQCRRALGRNQTVFLSFPAYLDPFVVSVIHPIIFIPTFNPGEGAVVCGACPPIVYHWASMMSVPSFGIDDIVLSNPGFSVAVTFYYTLIFGDYLNCIFKRHAIMSWCLPKLRYVRTSLKLLRTLMTIDKSKASSIFLLLVYQRFCFVISNFFPVWNI